MKRTSKYSRSNICNIDYWWCWCLSGGDHKVVVPLRSSQEYMYISLLMIVGTWKFIVCCQILICLVSTGQHFCSFVVTLFVLCIFLIGIFHLFWKNKSNFVCVGTAICLEREWQAKFNDNIMPLSLFNHYENKKIQQTYVCTFFFSCLLKRNRR